MAINYDNLPSQSVQPVVLEKGWYKAKIEKAEMKQGKDLNKPQYLNIMYRLYKNDGTSAGVLYDILSESDSEYVAFKIKRFIDSLGIKLTGMFELKDLAKIVIGKELFVLISVSENKQTGQDQNQINIFDNEIYRPIEEADVPAEDVDFPDAIPAPTQGTEEIEY